MNIYIITPPYAVTGGPEYCHQICAELNKHQNVTAKIAYYMDKAQKKDQSIPIHPQLYAKTYNNPYVINKTIQPDGICIFPQTSIVFSTSKYFKDVKLKFLIWMSVNFYIDSVPVEYFNVFPYNMYHLCPSQYSKDYLRFAKVQNSKIFSFADPPNRDFFQLAKLAPFYKENIVAFQPSKNLLLNEVIYQLEQRKRYKNIKLSVIHNLTHEEVLNTLKKSKVLLHLGYNPGLERVQQEAVLLDNCIIQSTFGCSKYYNDVPISNQYKFDLTQPKIVTKIANQIEECIDNYQKKIKDFYFFKNTVIRRQEDFEKDVLKIIDFINFFYKNN